MHSIVMVATAPIVVAVAELVLAASVNNVKPQVLTIVLQWVAHTTVTAHLAPETLVVAVVIVKLVGQKIAKAHASLTMCTKHG